MSRASAFPSTCSYEYLTAIYSFREIEEQKVFSLLELPLLSLLHFLALLPHSCRLQLAASYKYLHRCSEEAGVSGNSRSWSFPRMEASDSLPEFREWIFFIPFPFPNFGNGFFSFPSRSRISGMDFFHSLPVPEFREWIFSIPFPFPNFGNGFFPFPSRSRIDPFKVGNQKGKWEILRDASIPTFSASCTFHPIYMPSIC